MKIAYFRKTAFYSQRPLAVLRYGVYALSDAILNTLAKTRRLLAVYDRADTTAWFFHAEQLSEKTSVLARYALRTSRPSFLMPCLRGGFHPEDLA